MSSEIESRFERATGGAGYGEYASASGYGHMRYVDCNSALALLGFILFVDILRDVIEYITDTKRRKKRWALGAKDSDVLSFIMDGGADHLYDQLPNMLGSLLESSWKFDVSDVGLQCMQHNFCTANYDLADNYGKAGRVFGTLLSNVVSRAVSEGSNSHLQSMLAAAKTGRRGENCFSKFSNCPHINTKYIPKVNNQTLTSIRSNEEHQKLLHEFDNNID